MVIDNCHAERTSAIKELLSKIPCLCNRTT